MAEANDAREVEMIRAAIRGDADAFDAVVRHYSARLRWLIQLRLSPAIRARVGPDDVLQETFLVVAKQLSSLEIDSEAAFWTWLCRVVEQRLIDVRRRHVQAAARDVRREQPIGPANPQSASVRLANVLMDSGTSPSGKLRTAEQRESLEAALATLPASYREVIVLRILEGLSVSEAAEIMGRSPGAISVLLSKAVRRLGTQIMANEPKSEPGFGVS